MPGTGGLTLRVVTNGSSLVYASALNSPVGTASQDSYSFTICIQSPAKISVSDSVLLVERNGPTVKVPLEDIWVLIIETHRAQISTSALSSVVDAGIGVMLCGDNHMPNGLLLPLGAHSRHAAIVEDQLAISKPLSKRIWQRIVMQKIKNQARVLELQGIDSTAVSSLVTQVHSGDKDNREAVAAQAYFKSLTSESTRRNGPLTAALDYGYAVLRAGIAREAVSGGWLVSRGIHHSSVYNAFNLVDDLIEPFRPVVDLMVMHDNLGGELTKEKRANLASVFELLVKVEDETMSVQTAIQEELDGLKRSVLQANASLMRLPEVLPLERARLE